MEARNVLGWVMIGTLSSTVLAGALRLLLQACRRSYRWCKSKCCKRCQKDKAQQASTNKIAEKKKLGDDAEDSSPDAAQKVARRPRFQRSDLSESEISGQSEAPSSSSSIQNSILSISDLSIASNVAQSRWYEQQPSGNIPLNMNKS